MASAVAGASSLPHRQLRKVPCAMAGRRGFTAAQAAKKTLDADCFADDLFTAAQAAKKRLRTILISCQPFTAAQAAKKIVTLDELHRN